MKYGEKFTQKIKNSVNGKVYETSATYKYTEWHGWHTDNVGDGLWNGDTQILGTCQFSVAGCSTEKAAKAKIRKCVRGE